MATNKAINNLFKIEPEPTLFTFHLPDLEEDEKTIKISAAQLKRIISITAVIVAKDCRFEQVIMPTDDESTNSISFLIKGGDIEGLKKLFDEILGDHTDEIIDTHDSAE